MDKKTEAPTTIDEYIARCPAEVQPVLAQVRAVIRESAPAATEKISYQMPTFYLGGNLSISRRSSSTLGCIRRALSWAR